MPRASNIAVNPALAIHHVEETFMSDPQNEIQSEPKLLIPQLKPFKLRSNPCPVC